MRDIVKFSLRISVFLILFFLAGGIYFYFFVGNLPQKKLIGGAVYNVIRKSKVKKPKTKKLLIGDSIANQIYNNNEYNDEPYSLCSNQAISMVGQYCLLRNFIDSNKHDSLEVILIYRPSSFRNKLDQNLCFNYFLKPFYRDEYQNDISTTVLEQVQKMPGYWLVNFESIRMSRWSPSINSINNPHEFRISEISAEYIKKCDSLCIANGYSFEILSPFMSNEFSANDFNAFKQDINEYQLNKYFVDFFDEIVWLDKKLFADGSHLKKNLKKETLGSNFLNL